MIRALARKVVPERLRRRLRAGRSADSSQAGEAPLLETLVAEFTCDASIIDVGAHDGVSLSNSLPFVRRGWRAILIEPAPAVFAKLTTNHGHRQNVTLLQVACADQAGEAELYLGSDGAEGFLSTLCRADNDWFRRARSSQSVTVKTETLTNLLAAHHAPARPGILLVDCEGMDYEVLLGLDLARFRPTLLVTEEYEWEPAKHAAKYALLIHGGYSLVQKVGCNTIWVDRSARPRHSSA